MPRQLSISLSLQQQKKVSTVKVVVFISAHLQKEESPPLTTQLAILFPVNCRTAFAILSVTLCKRDHFTQELYSWCERQCRPPHLSTAAAATKQTSTKLNENLISIMVRAGPGVEIMSRCLYRPDLHYFPLDGEWLEIDSQVF